MTEPKKKYKVKKVKVNENGHKGVKSNLKRETSDSPDQEPLNKKVRDFGSEQVMGSRPPPEKKSKKNSGTTYYVYFYSQIKILKKETTANPNDSSLPKKVSSLNKSIDNHGDSIISPDQSNKKADKRKERKQKKKEKRALLKEQNHIHEGKGQGKAIR